MLFCVIMFSKPFLVSCTESCAPYIDEEDA